MVILNVVFSLYFTGAFCALTLLVGGRKGIRPVKNWVVGCWRGYLSGSRCRFAWCIWPSWCYCHSLCLSSVKSRLVLPSWYQLTRVVPDKGPLNVCVFTVAYIHSVSVVFGPSIFLSFFVLRYSIPIETYCCSFVGCKTATPLLSRGVLC